MCEMWVCLQGVWVYCVCEVCVYVNCVLVSEACKVGRARVCEVCVGSVCV